MASSSSRTYEFDQPGYEWEDPDIDDKQRAPCFSDDEGDNELTPTRAANLLISLLLELVYTNSLSAHSLCLICFYASEAGACDPISKFAVGPGQQSGKYQRRVDSATGVDLKKETKFAYKVPVAQLAKYDQARSIHQMVVHLPHEQLAAEVAQQPVAAELADEEWTAAYHEHPVVVDSKGTGTPVIPYALYLDGISFTRTDSLVGIFIYSLVTLKRHLCVVLRKSHFCQCGCRGWCTLHPIFSALKWSIDSLAAGVWPSSRHDGPWGADQRREAKSGTPLGFRGALLHLKGDWSEFSHRLGFADWSSKLYCCLFCQATRENRFKLEGFSPLTSPWLPVSQREVNDACLKCEVWVLLTKEQHAEVRAALEFDKRRDGGNGRCLSINLPALGLQRNDRLEPHRDMMDVMSFDKVQEFPVRALFWRRASETR